MELYEKIEAAVAAYLNQYVDGDLTNNPNPPASWFWPESLKNGAAA